MRKTFDAQLKELSDELVNMAASAEDAIDTVTRSLGHGGAASARDAMELTRSMDESEREIENRCFRLLLQQQPVARDLRTVSACLKMVTDLQRIGDQCANIAELSLLWSGVRSVAGDLAPIYAMSQKAAIMVKRSIHAYANRDLRDAWEVIALDDEVDELFQRSRRELVELLVDKREEADRASDLIIIAKYLERIADHAVNIARWAIYCVTGELVGDEEGGNPEDTTSQR